jgi:hypothetical protein
LRIIAHGVRKVLDLLLAGLTASAGKRGSVKYW